MARMLVGVIETEFVGGVNAVKSETTKSMRHHSGRHDQSVHVNHVMQSHTENTGLSPENGSIF